jgi:hypothetical protein
MQEIAIEQFRQIIENACATMQIGVQEASLTQESGVLRWLSPLIPVYPERPEQSLEFYVDFEITRVQSVDFEYQSRYLTTTLYLIGGETVGLPDNRELLGIQLAEIDRLNTDEPGLKFRFQTSDPNSVWIVIESDVRIEEVQETILASTLERLLECAEARYRDLYEVVMQRQ